MRCAKRQAEEAHQVQFGVRRRKEGAASKRRKGAEKTDLWPMTKSIPTRCAWNVNEWKRKEKTWIHIKELYVSCCVKRMQSCFLEKRNFFFENFFFPFFIFSFSFSVVEQISWLLATTLLFHPHMILPFFSLMPWADPFHSVSKRTLEVHPMRKAKAQLSLLTAKWN